MKNYSILFIMVVFFTYLTRCIQDSAFLKSSPTIQSNPTGIFQDTTGLEFDQIIHILSEQSDSMVTFQTYYGYPSMYGTFTKRNESIKITTIPLVKRNKITGLFKVYVTPDDSVNIFFYSKNMIDSAMTTYLGTQDYYLLNGAIQSYVFGAVKRGEPISTKYIQWLEKNENRIEERIGFYCIENWDCRIDRDNLVDFIVERNGFEVYLSKPDRNNEFRNRYGRLFEFECYYDYGDTNPTPRFGKNWNHFPWKNIPSTAETSNGKNHPKAKP